MKKLLLAAALCLVLFAPAARTAEAEPELAEWTVMYYICGADLESTYGYATEDLLAISECEYPQTIAQILSKGLNSEPADMESIPRVNIVMQLGGAKKWFMSDRGLGMNPHALQRWHYHCTPDPKDPNVLALDQELPLKSMAEPNTLSDFIRWGTKTYPAKKYALVLWGHGDGAKTGILLDELFGNDIMLLDELEKALKDGGTHFEAVIFEACLMANLETAYAIHDSASWMIASEDLLAGYGTPVSDWVQELICNPTQDGKTLGRNICDMTEVYYAHSESTQAKATLTMSVIDLSRIDNLVEKIRVFFKQLMDAYMNQSSIMAYYSACLHNAPEYGDGEQNMCDLASIFYGPLPRYTMDQTMRNDIINALNEAVVYCVRGSGRSGSHGLSFCFPSDFSPEELEIYAHNCRDPYYLMFLDAITSWTAPDWVYAVANPLPRLNEADMYLISAEKRMNAQGIPGLVFPMVANFGGVNYSLYQLDKKTGSTVCLGKTPCRVYSVEDNKMLYSAIEPWLWPSIDGELCQIQLISSNLNEALYNVPIQIGPEIWQLRYGREYKVYLTDLPLEPDQTHPSSYTVYGLWEGYDDDSGRLSRNVKSLPQLAGQEYRLLYAIDGTEKTGKTRYAMAEKHTLYRAMTIETMVLPAGTYYLEYEVLDIFMRLITTERIEMYWDGKTMTFPADFAWEGTMQLKWTY